MFRTLLCLVAAMATSVVLFAQAPAYYNNVNQSLTGQALLDELADKVADTETGIPSYTPGVWNALKQTDLVPGNSSRVILVYGYSDTDGTSNTDRTRGKDDNGGGQTDWNREHVYPKSLGQPNLGTSGPGADVHHLRSSDVSRNGQRGSRKFADGSGTSKITPQGHWYPGDEFKGDVARMIMYMYIRYGNRCLPKRVGVGTANSSDADMLNLFLEWNAEDPVSTYEDQRNPVVQTIQGNRNPFIDNPAFATAIWGGPQAEDRFGDTGGGGDGGGDNLLCNTTVNSFPYGAGFESGLDGWAQASAGDDFNWTRKTGATGSSGTGPSSAFAGSRYLYVEASSPNYSNKRAILFSPCYDLSGKSSASFAFRYHMYGASNMGSLALEASLDGTSWTSVWSRSSNQGNSWRSASVDLSDYLGQTVQLRFNGVTGTTWKGDMAIDALQLTTGGGGGSSTVAANLNIRFDNYPEETSWTIKNTSGTTVHSGGNYGSQADGSTINVSTPLASGCYTLTFNDQYGDGMCCSYGNGSFNLTSGGTSLASGGSFESTVTLTFCVGGASNTAPDAPQSLSRRAAGEGISIFPNPFADQLSIQAPAGARFELRSMTGQLIRRGVAAREVNVAGLAAGPYLLTVITDSVTETYRVIRR